MDQEISPKTLYVVATPIGHLGDLSPRAAATLAGVQLIAAEDTRHSHGLLQHLGIRTPMVPLHEHNEREQSQHLIQRLQAGDALALISDAGTPGISDPGARLIEAVHQAGFHVRTVPGPSALTAAVSASGLAALPMHFYGFLPPKAKARQDALRQLKDALGTLVFYEAPHRILECLKDLKATLPASRQMVLARELTKRFETIRRGSIPEILAWVEADNDQQRGEFVLVVEGASEEEAEALERDKGLQLALKLAESLPHSEAARLAAQLTGAKRGDLYAALLKELEGED